MNRAVAIGLRFVLGGSLVALWMSATPGGLERWIVPLFLLAFVASPVVLIALPFLGVAALRAGERSGERKKAKTIDTDPMGDAVGGMESPRQTWRPWWMSASIGAAVVAASLILIATQVPMRIAFVVSRSAFEATRVENTPWSSGEIGFSVPLDRRLGVLRVDRYGEDPRGGVYFRTGTSMDAIDTMSHGFVHKPNGEGTPFGRSRYRVRHLVDDWYVFSASDDSY
jgi:hypothetical protein